MAKDEETKENADKDSFSDEDEKAATPAETVSSKRGNAARLEADAAAARSSNDDADSDDANSDDADGDDSGSDAGGDDDGAADDGSADDDAEPAAAKPARSTPPAAAAEQRKPDHGHADDHGFAHVVSVQLLGGVLAALLCLTVLTVAVTKVNLGGEWNLIVAMVIATVKAGLVVTFFMHLLWDKKFNLLVFVSGVLFVILFISMALTDRKEYQPLIDQREAAQALQAK